MSSINYYFKLMAFSVSHGRAVNQLEVVKSSLVSSPRPDSAKAHYHNRLCSDLVELGGRALPLLMPLYRRLYRHTGSTVAI